MQNNFRSGVRWFFRIGGLVMIANAVWMAASANHWFVTIPADLAATGVANKHFIHDVAATYLTFGVALIWCGSNLQTCRPVYLCVTFFMVAHALGHILEILTGQLPQTHWWIDLPLVFLPAMALGWLALPMVWEKMDNQPPQ